MHSDNFNISTYFKRINYTGPAGADTVTLHALMRRRKSWHSQTRSMRLIILVKSKP